MLSHAPRFASTLPSPLPSLLLGLDFSCAPSARKPLTLARGSRAGQVVRLDGLDEAPSLSDFESWLQPAHPLTGAGFVMACDFPFGLPRPFVDALAAHGPDGLPAALSAHGERAPIDQMSQALRAQAGDRAGFQHLIDGWGQRWHLDRAPGSRLIHRRTDHVAPGLSSTSPLQTRYVPVGKMFYEGLPRLVDADITLPGQRVGQRPGHIALEAWPGLLAAQVIGRQRSYKSETDATPERLVARMDLIDALEQGRTPWGLRLKLRPAQRDHLVQDPKGDRVDAVLCLMQAARAHSLAEGGDTRWGLPVDLDPVEGWIIGAAP